MEAVKENIKKIFYWFKRFFKPIEPIVDSFARAIKKWENLMYRVKKVYYKMKKMAEDFEKKWEAIYKNGVDILTAVKEMYKSVIDKKDEVLLNDFLESFSSVKDVYEAAVGATMVTIDLTIEILKAIEKAQNAFLLKHTGFKFAVITITAAIG